MTGRGVRRGIWAVASVVVLVAAAVVLVPYVASTRIVRERVAVEIGRWSGYRVTIGAPPVLQVWPRLSAVLEDVTFSDWSAGSPVVATAERIEIELSALAALQGNAVFSAARVVRPVVMIAQDADRGLVAQLAGKGRLRSAIDKARAEIAANDGAAAVDSGAFGRLRIVDGRIVRAGQPETAMIGGIEAAVDWPMMDGAGSVTATGTWNGEAIKLDLRSDNPLRLLAGGQAQVDIQFGSTPLTARFDGSAQFSTDPSISGTISIETKSPDRLALWAGADIPGWERLKSLSVAGAVVGDRHRAKLDQASVVINGDTGKGALEATIDPARLALSGSLAFDVLSLDTVPAIFLPLATAPREEATLLPALRVDMRLSAARAKAAGIDISDLAATIQIKDSYAAFDLLDASAFGGMLDFGLRVDRLPDTLAASLRLAATDIDGGALGGALAMTRLVPTGKGSVTLDLKGQGADVASALSAADGRATLRFGPGALSKFDLDAFLRHSVAGGFFPLSDTANGDLPVDSVEVDATVTDGIARIDKAQARAGGRLLWLSGVMSYADQGLALSGGIGPASPAPTGGAASDEAKFFVGGSWSTPFISPMGSLPPIE